MSPEVLARMIRVASPEQLAVALGVLVDLDSGYEGSAADGENRCPLCNGLDEHDQTCVLGRVRAALEPIETAEMDDCYGFAPRAESQTRDAQEGASDAADDGEREKMRLANQLATWNAVVPAGTRVAYRRIVGDEEIETRTRSKAWALGHGAGVVLLEGEVGGWYLDFVRALPVADAQWDRPSLTPEQRQRVSSPLGSALAAEVETLHRRELAEFKEANWFAHDHLRAIFINWILAGDCGGTHFPRYLGLGDAGYGREVNAIIEGAIRRAHAAADVPLAHGGTAS